MVKWYNRREAESNNNDKDNRYIAVDDEEKEGQRGRRIAVAASQM